MILSYVFLYTFGIGAKEYSLLAQLLSLLTWIIKDNFWETADGTLQTGTKGILNLSPSLSNAAYANRDIKTNLIS